MRVYVKRMGERYKVQWENTSWDFDKLSAAFKKARSLSKILDDADIIFEHDIVEQFGLQDCFGETFMEME